MSGVESTLLGSHMAESLKWFHTITKLTDVTIERNIRWEMTEWKEEKESKSNAKTTKDFT